MKVVTIALATVFLAACSDRGGGERRAGSAGAPGESGTSSAQGGTSTASDPQARAGGAPTTTPGQQAQAGAGTSITGQVVSASNDELVLKQQGAGQELKLKVDDSTQVMIDGRQASMEGLKEGTQVRASYDASQGEPKATRIEAMSSGAPGMGSPSDQPTGTTGGAGSPGQTSGSAGGDTAGSATGTTGSESGSGSR